MEYNVTWSDPSADGANTRWTRKAWNEMREKYDQHGGTYLNIDSYDEDGHEWIKETYRHNYMQLQKIKKKYDPMNLFRLNPNIVPR